MAASLLEKGDGEAIQGLELRYVRAQYSGNLRIRASGAGAANRRAKVQRLRYSASRAFVVYSAPRTLLRIVDCVEFGLVPPPDSTLFRFRA